MGLFSSESESELYEQGEVVGGDVRVGTSHDLTFLQQD